MTCLRTYLAISTLRLDRLGLLLAVCRLNAMIRARL